MKKSALIFFIFFNALFQNVKADHIAGGDLTYVCLGADQYQINLNLFVDCLGFDPGATQSVNFISTCGGTAGIDLNVTNPGGTEISQLCPSQLINSTCHGGTLPGMWVFHFTGIITLTSACDTWTMSWTICCRNAAILNLLTPDGYGSYLEATLNSGMAACNNSPYFTAQPIPYVCAGQLVNYNYGVVETDGDSLYYSLTSALDDGATPLAYTSGYSATSPIPGIVINSATGTLTFTPLALGNFVVVVVVREYDNAGHLIGTVMRDIQFIVQNCLNTIPDALAGEITSLSGSAVLTSPFSLDMCEGSTFTFNAIYTDVNPGDSLSFISDILTVMPGATITITGSNPLTATISWVAPLGSANTNIVFDVTISDGACPVPGQQTFVYVINVRDRTAGGGDHIICGNESAILSGVGGSTFTWSVLSGSPMAVGTNFSCNPCKTPVASPSTTTTYQVESDLSGTCINKDTVTVTLVSDFTHTISQSAVVSCLLSPIQLNTTVSPSGIYIYNWSPSIHLSDPTIADPTASFTIPGTYTYYEAVTSPEGCVKHDTATITINASYPPKPVVTVSDDTVCTGSTINLSGTFEFTTPITCSTSSTGCGSSVITTVGTGTDENTIISYPAPYGNWYTSVKEQFLFTAAELNAVGIIAGKIDQLDFFVSEISGTTTYHEYTINMGCTNLTTLSNWVYGLYNVFSPKNHTVVSGWNAHAFDNSFEWDGVSNIVVEICNSEFVSAGIANYSNNCVSPYTTTSFTSCLYNYGDTNPMCPDSTMPMAQNERPNMRFHYCVVPDVSDLTFLWSPSAGLTTPGSAITNAVVNNSTTYLLITTDIVTGCIDSSTVLVIASMPDISFNAAPALGLYPLTVNFINTSDPAITSFIWNFGDPSSGTDNTSTVINPSHTYMTEGNYIATLTNIDASGCSDTIRITIDVLGTSSFFIPNVFTPGGANPTFKVTGLAIAKYSIEIFNRWGKKLFESTDLNDSWTGDNAIDGTYFYIIKATGQDSKEYYEKGYIQLIR